MALAVCAGVQSWTRHWKSGLTCYAEGAWLSWDPQTIYFSDWAAETDIYDIRPKKKWSYSSAGRFLYCLTDVKPVAPYVAVSRSFFCLQPSLFMNLQTVFFPRTGSLNFFRLLRVVITPSVRLNRSAVNAVQWRHYSLTFALIHAKSKTRFSSGKPRNTVWKCLHDTELLHFFRS